jgi:uncharacterized protein (TIGR02246 family)
MKRVLIALMLVCLVGTAGAEADKGLKPGIAGPKSDIPHEEAIRNLYAEFVGAWNRHDVPAMVAMWAADGDHQEPDGRHPKGRKAVEELLRQEHSGVFKKTRLTLSIDGVWFITSALALVDGTYELVGVVGPDGKELPPRKGDLTSVLINEQGRWWVAASRTMIPVSLVWRPQ